MFSEKIPSKQLGSWLFATLTPILIQFLSSTPWYWIVLFGVTSWVVTAMVVRFDTPPKWLRVAQAVFLIILLGELLGCSADSWQTGNRYPAVPLLILGLATWSAQKGVEAAARVGCVLFWAVLLLYGVVLTAGVGEIEYNWFVFTEAPPNWQGILLLLTPVIAVTLQKKEKTPGKMILTVAFVLLASIVTAGVLSPMNATQTENAFYYMSRGLKLADVLSRFEAFLSAAMTAGWFGLCSLYLSVIASHAETIFQGCGRGVIIIAAIVTAGWMLCGLHISAVVLTIIASVFWVVLPILAQGIVKRKKS